MADMQVLSKEMEKLRQQIVTLQFVSGYKSEDDIKLRGWELKDADERQMMEEYVTILYMLDKIRGGLDYHSLPVKEEGILHLNKVSGRYETEKGYCYTSGSGIEFLRLEKIFNYETQKEEEVEIWTTSRLEHDGKKYYIVGYQEVKLQGLKVRMR